MRITKIKPIAPRLGSSPRRAPTSSSEMELSTSEAAEDSVMQAALLNHVLDEHPTSLRRCDLVRELCEDPSEFGERDAVDRAINVLVKVGLLDRNGEYVLPTPSALHFRKLPQL